MSRIGWIPVLLLIGLCGCTNDQKQGPQQKPPEVYVSTPFLKDVTDYEDFTGRTESVASVEVRARVSGYLQRWLFTDGDDVKQSDVLFEIDPRPYQATYNQAVGQRHLQEANLKYQSALYDRELKLYQQGSEPLETLQLNRAQRDSTQASVEAAKAAEAQAKLNLEWTKVTSPISGRVSRRMVDPGNLVQADNTMLTTIVALDPMYAYFDIDERTMLRLQRLVVQRKIKSVEGGKVPVYLALADEGDQYLHPGVIDFMDNRVDAATGTLRARGLFPNAKHILSPGLFVRVRIRVGEPHKAVVLPERALGTDQGRKFVYVVNGENKAIYRSVKSGPPQEDGLRVIEEGLKPGEKVIVSGLQRVRQGAEVDPKPEEEAPGHEAASAGAKAPAKAAAAEKAKP
jgi:multidrug efflux system membrane fusion protein